MGGALGGVLFLGGSVLSTAASVFGNEATERAYYRSMAATADAQARQVRENARRNVNYLFQDATYQSNQLSNDYANLLAQQKTSLAGNGLDLQSATAKLILKNSRLNAQLDQEMLADNTNRSIYEMQTQADLEAQQYYAQARRYRRSNKSTLKLLGRLGNAVSGLFSFK